MKPVALQIVYLLNINDIIIILNTPSMDSTVLCYPRQSRVNIRSFQVSKI